MNFHCSAGCSDSCGATLRARSDFSFRALGLTILFMDGVTAFAAGILWGRARMTENAEIEKETRGRGQIPDMEAKHSFPTTFVKRLQQIPLFLASVSVVVLTLLITLEVLLRTFLGVSTLISDEVGAYLMVLILFMGLTYTFEKDRMIQLDFVSKKFSNRTKGGFHFGFLGLGFLYSVILSYEFMALALKSKAWGVESVLTLRMPLYIPQMIMAIGTIFLSLYFLRELFAEISRMGSKSRPKK